jgi:tRNA-dihydrouridine synthase A
MVTAQAIINGKRDRLLDFNTFEKPISLQIAASNPEDVYKAVKIAEEWDYDEINLNAGCPSDGVAGNEMGACLMAYPELVRDMVKAMKDATRKPVTVKHRIGIEGRNILPSSFERTLLDKYEDMMNFINKVEEVHPDRYTIHARIAILEGLSPKGNRDIPPLRYEEVYKVKKENPGLQVEINGGIKTIEEIEEHLSYVDGVMIGRAAYDNPIMLREVDKFFKDGEVNNISRREIIESFIPYVEGLESRGENPHVALTHTLGLFLGAKGSKLWKQLVSPANSSNIRRSISLKEGLETLPKESLDSRILI